MRAVADKRDQQRDDFVPYSSDLRRIAKIPRRSMSASDLEWLADEMTQRLKTPRGTMRLRPIQALALYELATVGGLFGILRVGAGKTLISFLAATVLKSQRPLLIVPAKLVDKTKYDKELLEQHFRLPHFMRIMTYDWLGREQAGEDEERGKKSALDEWAPDLVVLDEAHRAKNYREAAVVRRLRRFFRAHQNARCAAMSGTMTKRSIMDFAHILTWCLPAQLLPIPTHWNELELWSQALDEKKSGFGIGNIDPGALETLCADAEDARLWERTDDKRHAARVVFRRRLVDTPGVVATVESPIDASLIIRARRVELSAEVDAVFAHLRQFWELPDGWTLSDGLEMFRHARDLALGFYLKWEPRPPIEWLQPRKNWHAFVRSKLKHSRKLDSELQVRKWVGALKKHAATNERKLDTEDLQAVECLDAWLAVRDTFKPNTVPVWVDSSALAIAAEWAHTRPGIVWVENPCVGQRLRDEFGLSYYGEQGRDDSGRFIDAHDPKKSLVASIASSGEGRNLQAWCNNLCLDLPPSGARLEQLLGRTHRDGQQADEVEFEFVVSCREHFEAYQQAMADTRYIEAMTGSPQKMLLATHAVAHGVGEGRGPRWWANDRREQ